MIDKVKLIEKFLSEGWSGRVVKIVENFAEESEIDFDRLRNKFEEEKCNEADCHLPMCNKIECYTNFLKSKHLSASKPKQLPVKKTWTLKKEYFDFAQKIFNTTMSLNKRESKPEFEQYYDQHEEPDYSQIPNGSIVEIECLGDKFYRTFVKFEHENIFTKDGEDLEPWLESHVNLRIVKLAKE